MISANKFIIHKSRKQAFFQWLNCVSLFKIDCAVFFFLSLSEKNSVLKTLPPNEIRVACMQKITANRYPLKFNLHKKQFVSLCFLVSLSPSFSLSFSFLCLFVSEFTFRVARIFFLWFFFSISKRFDQLTTNYVIILYFIWNEVIVFLSFLHICCFSFGQWFKSIFVLFFSKYQNFSHFIGNGIRVFCDGKNRNEQQPVNFKKNEWKKIVCNFFQNEWQRQGEGEVFALFAVLLDLCCFFFRCAVKLWLFNEWAAPLNCGFSMLPCNAGHFFKFRNEERTKNHFLLHQNEVISN